MVVTHAQVASTRSGAAPPPSGARPSTGDRRSSRVWYALALLTTTVILLVPLHWSRRYYFYGDTQIGSFGQWYHLGQLMLDGKFPYLDLGAWRGGNYAAEGQWGLFNPVIMVIALAATKTSSPLLFATAVKWLTAYVGMSGVFVLARHYGVRAQWAFVAATASLLGGVTQYLDLGTWMTGLEVWALLPWCWWSIRRTMIERTNPLPALVACYLMVTIGYVYGTIYLALVFLACLVDAVRLHGRGAVGRALGLGVCAGLLTLTIYLPGLLTAPVTVRAGLAVTNDNSLPIQVSNYFASMLPAVAIPANGIGRSGNPVGYIAWFLPLLAWVDHRRIRAVLRPLTGMALMLVAMMLWSLGPTVVGPLRYPARVMPIVAMCALVLTVALLSQASTAPGRGRLGLSLALVLVGSYLALTRSVWNWRPVLLQAVIVTVGVLALWLLWRTVSRGPSRARFGTVAVGAVAVIIAVWGVGLQVVQHSNAPGPASTNRNMPAHLADYKTVLTEASGDVMVVGDQRRYLERHASAARDILIGSSWYVTGHNVANSYTTISFRTYMKRYCIGIVGTTCRGALAQLLSTEPGTDTRRADLLSVSTILIFRPTTGTIGDQQPPPGWHVTKRTEYVVMWVRDKPLPPAGGVVHASAGTSVRQVSRSTNATTVHVDAVPAAGGTLTFSRLAWPGYTVSGGATLASPVDGYLLTVHVPAGATGKNVTVRFTPPAWRIELAAWALSLIISALWSTIAFVRWRRRRPGSGSSGSPTPMAGASPGGPPAGEAAPAP